eukprot:1538516-Rhodomonas_salina.4
MHDTEFVYGATGSEAANERTDVEIELQNAMSEVARPYRATHSKKISGTEMSCLPTMLVLTQCFCLLRYAFAVRCAVLRSSLLLPGGRKAQLRDRFGTYLCVWYALPGGTVLRSPDLPAQPGMSLHECYAMPGTDQAHGPNCLHRSYAISGTDPAYATRQ